jgi:hypothetical protein
VDTEVYNMKWLRLAAITAVIFTLGSVPAFGYLHMRAARHYAKKRVLQALRHARKVRRNVVNDWDLLEGCFRYTSMKIGCGYGFVYDFIPALIPKRCDGMVMVVQRGRTVSTYTRHPRCYYLVTS